MAVTLPKNRIDRLVEILFQIRLVGNRFPGSVAWTAARSLNTGEAVIPPSSGGTAGSGRLSGNLIPTILHGRDESVEPDC